MAIYLASWFEEVGGACACVVFKKKKWSRVILKVMLESVFFCVL